MTRAVEIWNVLLVTHFVGRVLQPRARWGSLALLLEPTEVAETEAGKPENLGLDVGNGHES